MLPETARACRRSRRPGDKSEWAIDGTTLAQRAPKSALTLVLKNLSLDWVHLREPINKRNFSAIAKASLVSIQAAAAQLAGELVPQY